MRFTTSPSLVACVPKRHRPGLLAGLVLGFAASASASAFSVNITPGPPMIFLQVGNGSFSGHFNGGGTPQNNATINVVSVTVPADQVGNGTAQAMTSNSTQSISYWDGYTFCSPPAQMYIGGFYRQPGSGGTATLGASSSTPLSNGAGGTIPFTQISWTSSGNGDTGAESIPGGTFTGGTQTLATFRGNTWNESCHTFSYGNSMVPPAGTFTGRVTYTLSAP